MGCSGSKLDDLEAVALCRSRTNHLSDAIRHRYALASSHSAYSASLLSLAASLHRLLDPSATPTPLLSLPPHRKGDPLLPPSPSPPPPAPAPAPQPQPHLRSHSGSGSHIQFHPSSSSSDSTSHSEDSSPMHHHQFHNYGGEQQQQQQHEILGPSILNFHYAKNQPRPPYSVHFAAAPENASASSYPNYDTYPNPNPYPYADNSYYGFSGNSSPPPPRNLAPPPESLLAAPKPPPPPSPPRVSTWDFLNPFELQDTYYPAYTPSQSSREVRDEEGIPELEDDESEEHEVVKEVYSDQKFVGSASREYNGSDEGICGVGENSRPVEVENEDDVVEKNVVADEAPPQQNVAASSKPRRYESVAEIGSEIRVQFERAAEAAAELSKLLEVGKQPYRFQKSSVIEVSSRMMCVTPSNSNGEDFLSFEEDMTTSSGNLSSTLQKLYIWERKLQDEVRVEEKMRLLLDKNHKRLRHLVERGAEDNKIEEVQKMIRKLTTKIRIAIQVVDSISNKINTLRDEELCPQIDELIKGLMRMWQVMLECHQIQCQVISEAKTLDSITTGVKLNESHLNAIVDLELELLRWTGNFSSWINAQKNYVKSLNGWLVLCLRYEPEVTADGAPPYSPGRIGAPRLFVICNSWSQDVDRISEFEVINAAQGFAAFLRHIWEQNNIDPHHKVMPNGDMERLIRAQEREAQIMQKEVDALNKKLVLVSGQNEVSSLHIGLKQIFEALESFTANSLKAYEELYMRSEEESD